MTAQLTPFRSDDTQTVPLKASLCEQNTAPVSLALLIVLGGHCRVGLHFDKDSVIMIYYLVSRVLVSSALSGYSPR